jgi:hypothetical protein
LGAFCAYIHKENFLIFQFSICIFLNNKEVKKTIN